MKITKVVAALLGAYGHVRQRELHYSLNAFMRSGSESTYLRHYA